MVSSLILKQVHWHHGWQKLLNPVQQWLNIRGYQNKISRNGLQFISEIFMRCVQNYGNIHIFGFDFLKHVQFRFTMTWTDMEN